MQTQMVASTSLPFVAEQFGEIYSSPGPNKPNVNRILITYLVIGLGVGVFAVLIKSFVKKFLN